MNIALGLTLAVSAILAVIFIVIRVKRGGYPGLISKAIASSAFLLTGVILSCLNTGGNPIVEVLFILGLMLGVAGDVFIDFRQVSLENKPLLLNFGMISFGVGHAFYLVAITLYSSAFVDVTLAALTALAAIPIAVLSLFGVIKMFKMDMRGFVRQTFLYLLILLYVALYTFSLSLIGGVPLMPLYTVGAFLFLASDFILSFQLFGGQEKNHIFTVLIHVFYYVAQLFYAALLAFIL